MLTFDWYYAIRQFNKLILKFRQIVIWVFVLKIYIYKMASVKSTLTIKSVQQTWRLYAQPRGRLHVLKNIYQNHVATTWFAEKKKQCKKHMRSNLPFEVFFLKYSYLQKNDGRLSGCSFYQRPGT
jgi:hypothetical protein